MGNPRATRKLVHVLPYAGSDIRYGFNTNASAATSTALGHVVATGEVAKLVIGCNMPKPGNASKGGDSSFYDIGNAAALKAAKWRLTSPLVSRPTVSSKINTVYVVIDGIKYGWRMPRATYTALGAERAALGIVDATPTMKDIAFGVSAPKPPRVKKTITSGTGANQTEENYSTFFDPSGTLPAGWSGAGNGKASPAGATTV